MSPRGDNPLGKADPGRNSHTGHNARALIRQNMRARLMSGRHLDPTNDTSPQTVPLRGL